MAKRYRVLCDYIKYPADKKSFAAIDKAGGLRNMSDGQKDALNIVRARKGDLCTGMQPRHIAHCLAKGSISELPDKAPRKADK